MAQLILMVLLLLSLLTFAPHLEGFRLLEEHLRRMGFSMRYRFSSIIISKINHPVEVILGDVGLFDKMPELSDIAIHELLSPWFFLFLLF